MPGTHCALHGSTARVLARECGCEEICNNQAYLFGVTVLHVRNSIHLSCVICYRIAIVVWVHSVPTVPDVIHITDWPTFVYDIVCLV